MNEAVRAQLAEDADDLESFKTCEKEPALKFEDFKKDREKLVTKIRGLAQNPRPAGAEKLAGDDKYRMRHGLYRRVVRDR